MDHSDHGQFIVSIQHRVVATECDIRLNNVERMKLRRPLFGLVLNVCMKNHRTRNNTFESRF